MQRVIYKNSGYRRQFLVDDKGTTLIVVFGVPPYAHEDDAYRALKTALEIAAELRALGLIATQGVATGYGAPLARLHLSFDLHPYHVATLYRVVLLRVRSVYVGSVGSSRRQEHAVVGDTVNTSARLSARAKLNGILVDAATYDKCNKKFKFRVEGEIKVKGKERVIQTYAVLGMNRLGTSPERTDCRCYPSSHVARRRCVCTACSRYLWSGQYYGPHR